MAPLCGYHVTYAKVVRRFRPRKGAGVALEIVASGNAMSSTLSVRFGTLCYFRLDLCRRKGSGSYSAQ